MDDPYGEPTEFDMALQRERARIIDSGATGGPEGTLTPSRIRRAYTPFHLAGVGTSSSNVSRDVRHVLQGATPRVQRDSQKRG